MTTIRSAEREDVQTVAEIHVQSWRTAYRGIMPDALLAAQDVDSCRERWDRTLKKFPGNLLVAVDEQDKGIGFCYLAQVADDANDASYDGRIYALHVRPDRRRQGTGSSLMQAAFRRLRILGCRSAIVWTLRDLAPTRRFYEALDGTVVKSKISDFDGTKLPELAYAWDDLTSL